MWSACMCIKCARVFERETCCVPIILSVGVRNIILWSPSTESARARSAVSLRQEINDRGKLAAVSIRSVEIISHIKDRAPAPRDGSKAEEVSEDRDFSWCVAFKRRDTHYRRGRVNKHNYANRLTIQWRIQTLENSRRKPASDIYREIYYSPMYAIIFRFV